MANADRPMGLKPVKMANGSPWNGQVTMYYKSAASNAIYKGTCVKHGGSGDTLGQVPSCDLAGATDQILGVAVGFSNNKNIALDPTNLERDYCPASTAMYIAVVDSPDVIFEAQEDNGSSAHMEAGDIGQNIALATSSAGSTTTGLSSAELDSDGNAAGYASAPLLVVGVVDRPDNTMGSSADHTKWLVKIADHHFQRPTTGV